MHQPIIIETERLWLRPLRLSDADTVQRLAGEYEIAEMTLNIPHPYQDGMAEHWIKSANVAMQDGHRIELAVALKSEDDEPLIGAIAMVVRPQDRAAEIGYWIGKPYWNRGFATEAARAIVAFGFQDLGLNRIEARHLTKNPASGRVMQKIGMTYEGTHRQAGYRFGSYEDIAVYAILRDEFAFKS